MDVNLSVMRVGSRLSKTYDEHDDKLFRFWLELNASEFEFNISIVSSTRLTSFRLIIGTFCQLFFTIFLDNRTTSSFIYSFCLTISSMISISKFMSIEFRLEFKDKLLLIEFVWFALLKVSLVECLVFASALLSTVLLILIIARYCLKEKLNK